MSSGIESPSERPVHHTVGIFITRVVQHLPDGRLRSERGQVLQCNNGVTHVNVLLQDLTLLLPLM